MVFIKYNKNEEHTPTCILTLCVLYFPACMKDLVSLYWRHFPVVVPVY